MEESGEGEVEESVGARRGGSMRRPLRREASDNSLYFVGSRRGSLVVSPQDHSKQASKHHVQFHVNGSARPPTPPASPSSSDSSLGGLRPPDGGWGWVVVAAAFMVNLIADGITFSFGVMFVEFLNYFGESKSKTAWIGSLFMAMPLLSGPVASFLTDRYGCRRCCVAGGLMAAAGFIISSFTNSVELLILFFGIVAGIGLSLCYVAAVVIVAYYFESKRSFATGLSVCGSGIGTFLFAPITQFLLDEYGWRGATLIIAGFFLNLCVCGMLMKDLEWTKAKRRQRKNRGSGSVADTYSVTNQPEGQLSQPTGDELKRLLQRPGGRVPDLQLQISPRDQEYENTRLFSSLVNLPTFVRNSEKVPIEVLEIMTANRYLYQVLLKNYPSLLISKSFHGTALTAEQGRAQSEGLSARFLAASPESGFERTPWPRQSRTHHEPVRRAMPTSAYLKDLRVHRHSLTYRGAMLNINRYKLRASSCPDIYRNTMDTLGHKGKPEGRGVQQDLLLLLAEMLDLSYFTNIRFLLFAMSNFLLYTWYDVPYVYLTDLAHGLGYSETHGSWLISVIGILNMLGEVLLGWLGDLHWVNPSFVYALSMGLCGGVMALVPLLSDYFHLLGVAGAFGLFIAANYALTSIILVEQITIERFTNAYGLLLLVQGLANLVGPPLAGWIFDETNSYDLSFYLGGFFIALSGLLLVIPPIVDMCRDSSLVNKKDSVPASPQAPDCV